jgi:hypothetical protein
VVVDGLCDAFREEWSTVDVLLLGIAPDAVEVGGGGVDCVEAAIVVDCASTPPHG